MSWSNKVILITGASSGIGRGLALDLAKRGTRLGLLARRKDQLEDLVREVESVGGEALALPASVQDPTAIGEATKLLEQKFGPIDILIANAGIGGNTDGTSLVPADFAKVIDVNVLGVVNSVAAVVPGMIQRRQGQLVAISSLAAYRGLPKSGAYCASKAAVSIFFESLRLDLKTQNIDTTIIHPGFIKTPLTAGRHADMPFLLELDDAVKKIVGAIEKRKKTYAFPWQLASLVRLGMIMPTFLYDRISGRASFRE